MDRPLFDAIDRDTPAYDIETWREEQRQRRVARTETLHRIANEHAWKRASRIGAQSILLMCECGDGSCTVMFEVPTGVFERYHRRGDVFLINPGHELLDLEEVIARGPNFVAVEKVGLGRIVALEAYRSSPA